MNTMYRNYPVLKICEVANTSVRLDPHTDEAILEFNYRVNNSEIRYLSEGLKDNLTMNLVLFTESHIIRFKLLKEVLESFDPETLLINPYHKMQPAPFKNIKEYIEELDKMLSYYNTGKGYNNREYMIQSEVLNYGYKYLPNDILQKYVEVILNYLNPDEEIKPHFDNLGVKLYKFIIPSKVNAGYDGSMVYILLSKYDGGLDISITDIGTELEQYKHEYDIILDTVNDNEELVPYIKTAKDIEIIRANMNKYKKLIDSAVIRVIPLKDNGINFSMSQFEYIVYDKHHMDYSVILEVFKFFDMYKYKCISGIRQSGYYDMGEIIRTIGCSYKLKHMLLNQRYYSDNEIDLELTAHYLNKMQ